MTRAPTCTGRKKNGAQCTYPPLENQPHCRHHATKQYRDPQEAEPRPTIGATPIEHPIPESPMPRNPFHDIATFCQLHGIPYTPPTQDELAHVDNYFEHGAREHAWLRDQCQQRGITYPWTGDPDDFEEFGQHLRSQWATQRAAREHEFLDIASQIDRATTHQHRARQEPGQNRARQEAAPSPRTPAPGARPPAHLSASDRQEAQAAPTVQYRDRQEAEASPNTHRPTPTTSLLPEDEESPQPPNTPPTLKSPPDQIQTDTSVSKKQTPRCGIQLPSGEPCGGFAMRGETRCFHHRAETREQARAASSRGGLNSHGTLNAIDVPIDFSTPAGIQAALATITRAYISGHASHKQILGFTRIARLAVQNAHNRPRAYDYFEANHRLEQTLDDIQLALGLATYQERIDALAEHRERLNAVTEQAKELGIPARPSRPTLPRK